MAGKRTKQDKLYFEYVSMGETIRIQHEEIFDLYEKINHLKKQLTEKDSTIYDLEHDNLMRRGQVKQLQRKLKMRPRRLEIHYEKPEETTE